MMNPKYHNILDYGFESLDIESHKESIHNSIWEGEPNQTYQIFYSNNTGAILFSTAILFCFLWAIAYCFNLFLIGYNNYQEVSKEIITPIFIMLLIPFILNDIKEYFFRKNNKYWISPKGVIFRRGYLKKSDYILPWNNIQNIETSRDKYSIYFQTKSSPNVRLTSPNKLGEKPYIEVTNDDEYFELLRVLNQFVENEFILV